MNHLKIKIFLYLSLVKKLDKLEQLIWRMDRLKRLIYFTFKMIGNSFKKDLLNNLCIGSKVTPN
jgi:hypothetical protein